MADSVGAAERESHSPVRFRLPRVPERVFVLVMVAIYLAITGWVAFHHEVWSDEADPWLLMRDGGLGDLLEQTAYGHRGTPLFWFLAIWPLAAAGLPIFAQQLLNLAFAAGAGFIILRFAPFSRLLRALFVTSYIPAFEYAVIARPYAPMMFFLVAATALWRKRRERPLLFAGTVAFLAMTTVHGLIFAAVFGLLFLVPTGDRWRSRESVAIAIMLAAGVASVAQLWPRPQGQLSLYRVEWETLWFAVADAVFPGARPESALIPAAIVLVLALGAIRTREGQLFWWLTSLPIFAIFVFVWVAGHRHTGIILLALVCALWLGGGLRRDLWSRAAGVMLAVAFAWSVWYAAGAWNRETASAYSGSREAARYLASALPGTPVVAHRSMTASPILAYLPGRQFWYPGRRQWGSFMTWNRAFQHEQELPTREAIARAQGAFRGQRWALLLSTALPPEAERDFRLVWETKEAVWGRPQETYRIYVPVE